MNERRPRDDHLMIITFKSKAHADVVMLGDVARELIRLMGKSDALPSALAAGDIPRALSRLEAGLAELAQPEPDDDEDEDDKVLLHTRALPLIDMLNAASAADVPVMWEAGKRRY